MFEVSAERDGQRVGYRIEAEHSQKALDAVLSQLPESEGWSWHQAEWVEDATKIKLHFDTIIEAVEFIHGFDGEGLIVTDEDQIIERLREFALVDDTQPEQRTTLNDWLTQTAVDESDMRAD